MSTEQTEKKLTLEDPMSAETLKKLEQLSSTKLQLCERYVELEDEKVRCLVGIRQLDQEKQRVFEKELMDRGLAPNTPVEVNAKTGKIALVKEDGSTH